MNRWVFWVAIVAVGVDVLVHHVPVVATISSATDSAPSNIIAMTMTTIQLLSFAAGMLALVAAAQHARYWWVGILILSLFINAYGFFAPAYVILPGPSIGPHSSENGIASWATASPVVPALVALAYALWQVVRTLRRPGVAAGGVAPQT